MNFSEKIKAWIMLITLILFTGIGVGVTSFLGGSHWTIAVLVGVAAGASNVYHALAASPKDKADRAERERQTKAPFQQ